MFSFVSITPINKSYSSSSLFPSISFSSSGSVILLLLLLLLVQSSRRSPKSGAFRYWPLHTAPLRCSRFPHGLTLQALILQTLFLLLLVIQTLVLQTLFFQLLVLQTLFLQTVFLHSLTVQLVFLFELSSSCRYYALTRCPSRNRQASMHSYRCSLWGI